ncbi:hypothetical protein MVAC_06197 [Mycolicibacterium vaccae ATCC 25954]|uniref:Uncharacterized protein n=1 Tax=Mycolicibacterium vaccae ATCC 25954 TaxID=1194972 RepID=K0UVY8_MYCVA|nr:hypothetical protein MVAC_06197 [Mycolicibacterium vaccae ATCC 25954]
MSSAGTKVQVGAAACAIATAAILTPAVAAQADISLPVPAAPAITDIAAAPLINSVSFAEQGSWIWFGPTRDDGPTYTPVVSFYPLALVPGFLQPLFGWFADINFTACFLGLNARIGPYGTLSVGFSRGC